jgi:hypothetical protein
MDNLHIAITPRAASDRTQSPGRSSSWIKLLQLHQREQSSLDERGNAAIRRGAISSGIALEPAIAGCAPNTVIARPRARPDKTAFCWVACASGYSPAKQACWMTSRPGSQRRGIHGAIWAQLASRPGVRRLRCARQESNLQAGGGGPDPDPSAARPRVSETLPSLGSRRASVRCPAYPHAACSVDLREALPPRPRLG